MNNNDGETEMLTIDFAERDDVTLFTGRKNGKRAKAKFGIKRASQFRLKADQEQVITSSYFLGLLGEELQDLFLKVKDINELLDRINTEELNETSKNECIRAVRRGLRSRSESR
ncbi:hypothetical protein [Salinivibrio kushneri]|uniref:hypothetical protein n=1 Tax=Salinivibrio kushneri TaxID=1908198 RepID=UPI0022B463EB|nr:hypothetical protein [Salinivibrio kushneri]WBA13446.1 hypothetical protein O4546_14030 [Salinivibrio kushneri]